MDLQVVLSDYEVTLVPHPRPALTAVWSEQVVHDDVLPRPDDAGVLAVLDDYRITRVPKAS